MSKEFEDFLVFYLDGHRHGVPVREVREIIRVVAITPLPRHAPGIEGMIDVRGSITLVVDLRARLGLPAKPVELTDEMIVLSRAEKLVAFRIDRVEELVSLDPSEMTRFAPGREQEGMARLPDGLVVIHDISIFSTEGGVP